MSSWRGVGLVSGWQLTASLCFYAIFAATAFVRQTFDVSRALTGVAVTAVMLGYTLNLFGAGAAVDGYGERPVMIAGLIGLAAGMTAVAFVPATSFALLLVALVAVGATYATAMPSTNRAVLAVAPANRRNLAMNVKQVGVTAGSGLSAVLVTGAAATRFGWQGGFLAAGGLAAAVAAVFAVGYRGRGGTGELSIPDVRGLFTLSSYRTLVAAGFFLGAAVFTTTAYVVLDLTDSVGVSVGLAGTTLALVQVTGSLGRLGGGALADRLPGSSERANARVLLAQSVGAAGLFAAVAIVETPVAAVAAFAGLGLFILGFPGIFHSCLTAIAPEDDVGAATAGGQMALNVGGLLAPPAFGLLADTLSYGAGWWALAACALVAAGLIVPIAVGAEADADAETRAI